MKIIKNKKIYETYQKILPSFKDLIKKNSENPSPYWAEEVIGFDYIFDASPLIINKLRHHCYHLTGESPYTYRNHHNFKLDQFKSKLDLLKSISSEDLFVGEPDILGGFGFNIDGEMVNKDTLKFFECIIALNKSLSAQKSNIQKTHHNVCEIGAGWGGFAYYYSTIFPNSKYVIVDLPETLIFSYLFLTEAFPHKKIKLYDYEETSLNNCDFLLIPNGKFKEFDEEINLGVNICSFQEMTSNQVKEYVNKLHDLNCKHLYSLNRNLNINNLSLETSISSIMSNKFITSEIEMLKIPYSDLNIDNLKSKSNLIISIKKIIKLLLKINRNPSKVNYKYQHFLGTKT